MRDPVIAVKARPTEVSALTLRNPLVQYKEGHFDIDSDVKTITIISLAAGLITFVVELMSGEEATVTYCGDYTITWKPNPIL